MVSASNDKTEFKSYRVEGTFDTLVN